MVIDPKDAALDAALRDRLNTALAQHPDAYYGIYTPDGQVVPVHARTLLKMLNGLDATVVFTTDGDERVRVPRE